MATPFFLPSRTLALTLTNDTQFFWRNVSLKPHLWMQVSSLLLILKANWLSCSTSYKNINTESELNIADFI